MAGFAESQYKPVEKRWIIHKHDRPAVARLAEELGVEPIAAALLIARGHDTAEKAERFLNPCFEHLHEPALLLGLDAAVGRLQKAIASREKVMIWGDYDVDGTTGTVLLRRALRMMGADTGYHVPDRFTEGYGLNIPLLEKAKNEGYSLVVTVDCGTRSFDPIGWAQANGLDVIVTDHHLSDEKEGNPPAFAVVNPNQAGCTYPDKHLAGVGVAFKLAHALLRSRGMDDLVPAFLKIAAIGTVADIMDLTGENRAIVALGLRDLPQTQNHGLKALMEVAECREDMTSYHIGFRIAPRINAAGRMDLARHVIELFEAEDMPAARELARVLDSRNRERQQVQQRITELALDQAARGETPHFVVVAGDGWHRGVIGLAASRIAERLHRPTIVFSIEDGMAHGSARGITDFHLLKALDSCAEVFEQYGGHAAAAGMKICADRIEELKARLNEHAMGVLTEEMLIPRLDIDALVSSETLDLKLVETLKAFEPFGAGNPKPVFVTRGLFLREEPLVMKEKHLKLRLADRGGKAFEAVWWDGVQRSLGQTFAPGCGIEIAYTPEANIWQGNARLQLVVEDLRTHN